ncbi:MAG: GvpL/GvpF family gas vesicle protein [Desulfobaccales bacterium]
MSCLLYCIGRRREAVEPEPPPGVGRQPVFLVTQGDLSAAVSHTAAVSQTPDLADVKAHGRVVAFFHRQRSVIPMRYGCLLEDELQVARVLEDHGPAYDDLLKELSGCVEMGIRIMVPGKSPEPEISRGLRPAPEAASYGAQSGCAYLLNRQAHYAAVERGTEVQQRLAEQCLAHFTGLFVNSKIEGPLPHLPLLSLYFLVPASLVESFTQAFRRLEFFREARLLLSGPWPPYNFVVKGHL